jgi:hypothetical protein
LSAKTVSWHAKKNSIREALVAALDTRHLELGRGALATTAKVFQQQFGSSPAFFVADTNTFAAAGQSVSTLSSTPDFVCAILRFSTPEVVRRTPFRHSA